MGELEVVGGGPEIVWAVLEVVSGGFEVGLVVVGGGLEAAGHPIVEGSSLQYSSSVTCRLHDRQGADIDSQQRASSACGQPSIEG